MKRLVAFILALVGFVMPAPARSSPPGAVSVPLRNENGVLLFAATVNGVGQLLFVFDPGAGDLYTQYARERLRKRAPKVVCLSLACFPAAMEYFDADSTQLFPQHDPSLGVLAGSIGPQLLQRYVARIDYRASTLTLIPPARFRPPRRAQSFSLGFDSFKMPTIAAAVDGKPSVFELDVRAPRSMLFTPFLAHTGLRDSYGPGPGPYTLQSVLLGGIAVHGAAFFFSTASSGKFAANEVAGLIGNNVLSKFILTLDLPHRRAYLESATGYSRPHSGSI